MADIFRIESDLRSDYTDEGDSCDEEGTEIELDNEGESVRGILDLSTGTTNDTNSDSGETSDSDDSASSRGTDLTPADPLPLSSGSHAGNLEKPNTAGDAVKRGQTDHPAFEPQSEWDKALLTGRESKGRASDFFVSQNPILSTDSSEFYSTANAARATAPGMPNLKAEKNNLSTLPTQGTGANSTPPRQLIDVAASPIADSMHPPPPPRAQAASNQGQSIIKRARGSTIVQVQTNASSSASNYQAAPIQRSASAATAVSTATSTSTRTAPTTLRPQDYPSASHSTEGDLSAGVLPDVLMTMRQKIESMTLFDSDILRLTANQSANRYMNDGDDDDPMLQESRESLKRSSQQSISAAVLVSLAHKRYERRRLAAMEIEKVVRSLVVSQHQQVNKPVNNSLDRVRAILLLLSDDYVRSTSEDARKGGVVALAASAIGLKKANDHDPVVQECRDLILASVVYACQDHSQRVRYYATESLFNVVKGRLKRGSYMA
jgi:Vacuolar 14 Fab1-binding region